MEGWRQVYKKKGLWVWKGEVESVYGMQLDGVVRFMYNRCGIDKYIYLEQIKGKFFFCIMGCSFVKVMIVGGS